MTPVVLRQHCPPALASQWAREKLQLRGRDGAPPPSVDSGYCGVRACPWQGTGAHGFRQVEVSSDPRWVWPRVKDACSVSPRLTSSNGHTGDLALRGAWAPHQGLGVFFPRVELAPPYAERTLPARVCRAR